ncbi:MAG TPA: phospholipid scramblase-related protein [Cytophagales bacterium]|nr:phospholipid scramblase-related protein [Cytophagales bacterium]
MKEHVGMFKASNNFDIFDPQNNEKILLCREESLGFFTKIFRFTKYKRMTPFDITIKTPEGQKVLTVKKNVTWFLSKVDVFDENNQLVGGFKQKFFSIGGKFDVLDASGVVLCSLKGKWTSWDFSFIKDNTEFARVSKKWAGLGQELFTSADNYVLAIDERVPADNKLRILILAAVMCIDMVLTE